MHGQLIRVLKYLHVFNMGFIYLFFLDERDELHRTELYQQVLGDY